MNATLYVFEKTISTPLWNYTYEDEWFTSLAISGDGNYIAAGYNLYNNKKIAYFSYYNSTPLWENSDIESLSIAISYDGKSFVIGGKNLYLFQNISSPRLQAYTSGYTYRDVSITPNGNYIAAASSKGIFIFDEFLSQPVWGSSEDADAFSVEISNDGKYACGSYNTYLVPAEENSVIIYISLDHPNLDFDLALKIILLSIGTCGIIVDSVLITVGYLKKKKIDRLCEKQIFGS